MRRSGEESSKDPETGDEARYQYRFVSMSDEETFHCLESLFGQKNILAVANEETPAETMADPVAAVIAYDGAGHCDKHNGAQMKIALSREETGRQQDRFSGHRDSGVFEHYPEENNPVAVIGKEFEQRIEYIQPADLAA